LATPTSTTPIQTAETAVVQTASKLWEYIGKSSTTLIVAGLLALGVYEVHSKVDEYNAAIAKANADNDVFKTQLKQYQDEQQKDKALITAAQTKTVIIEKQIATNDTKTAQVVAEVTKPNETVQQVADEATKYLPETPTITPDSKLAFTPPTVQQFVANKVKLDGALKDMELDTNLLDTDNKVIDMQRAQIGDANKTIDDSKTTISAYEKAAKKSVWKRIEGFAIDGAIAVGAYEVGKVAAGK
jgi:hypothetical protein